MPWFYFIAILLCNMQSGVSPSAIDASSSAGDERMIKRFDFSEQNLGNFESFPRGWRPIYGAGYPRFLEARFDLESGHAAAPCFKFPLSGGSVGASYQVPDIPANPACEYRLSGWIRTENLVHGSARLSAYYLDQSLNKIVESERSSSELRSEGADSNGWQIGRASCRERV